MRFLSAFIEKITRILYTSEGEYKIQLHIQVIQSATTVYIYARNMNNYNLVDFPDEILLLIIRKLDMVDVFLFSFEPQRTLYSIYST